MSTAPGPVPLTSRPEARPDAGPAGWATFAGVVLLIGVTTWDFTAWGWITLGLGVFMVLTAAGLFAAAGWARWTAVGFAMLSALAQFGTVSAFPLWSLLVVALDITIIYQLVARWDAPRTW